MRSSWMFLTVGLMVALMTAILLRIIIYAAIIGFVYVSARRIWRDFTKQFRAEEKQIHERDLRERDAPGVITLQRDKDGTFRPPSNDNQPR